MKNTAVRILVAIVAALLLGSSQAHAQKSCTVQVHVKVIAAAPSFSVALPTVGQSGSTVYGSTPFTLSTPGQTAASFTTVQTIGAQNVIVLPTSGSTSQVSVSGQPTTVSQTSAAGVVTSVPRFEISDATPASTVVTSFGVGPTAEAGSVR